MTLSRRRFLGLLGGAAAVAGLSGCGALGLDTPAGQTGDPLTSAVPLPEPYRVPLPAPPVARPAGTTGGADLYEITQRSAAVEILPGLRTTVWGYDGIFPGPTLETRRGRPVVVRHRNELPVPTVVHLHGGHTPAESDGWPLDLVLPVGDTSKWAHAHNGMVGDMAAGTREYRYPMTQRAATLWYHDHRMDFTGPAVYRGLAGMHLVRDDVEDGLPLPRGDRELPLLICDRTFNADGSFRYPALDRSLRTLPGVEDDWMEGVLGDVVLVNGAPWPVHEVDAARYRLRILNGANARRFSLVLQVPGGPNLPMTQIGSDGGLLAAPVVHQQIDVAPAERFDVVVDFDAVPVGTEVTMINKLGTGSTRDVLRFRVVRAAADDSRVPERLADVEPLGPGPVRREFVFTRGAVGDHRGWTINGRSFDPNDSLADVPLGQTEVWRFRTDVHHPVHVHLDQFQVLLRNGRGPGRFDAGWKDTVDIRPGEIVDVAVRFTDYQGKFVMHCHNLEHEDMAMMATIRTI
ncbi:multicopper oxidase domain-containing protein [Pseudonocardia asaccharolytica]|uniref:Multicopper oxidase CueO n=1 Tax=Pseudonocardia asaccharolytica DSM 44247 = NBRC 16224 TaxID=1123024 RepID=A0A511D4T7_9PSEU|nr:multicopper oxidase domain-containing protein [Pseudonocardia asaccharolytica]GEL19802.1 spore coat protein A [Pseudonocardia asaccharolytica DSM 44247 = NBRC 16224]